ncbi:hypothetical protein KBI23_05240 [bacterium]|nr:hypothetical protein [bacterium]MBP9807931.1 hypothetical protein [bacterium]
MAFYFSFFSFFFLVLLNIQLPAYAREGALRLNQTHTFMGQCQLTVSAHGIRIENRDKLKFVLVAQAPDWRVTLFRNDDKTYFSQSLKEFQNTGLMSGFVMVDRPRLLKVGEFTKSSFKFCGYDVFRWTGRNSTFKYLPLGKIASQAESIIFAAYKVPTNGGLPVAYVKAQSGRDYTTGISEEGRLETLLDTSKIESVADDPKLFLAPSGYTKAKSVGVVFVGAAARNESGDFQNLFEMRPIGKQK